MVSMLSIGKQAVMAQRSQLAVTSNNISNVSTDGYTRQRTQTLTNVLGFGVGSVLTQRINNEYQQQEVWRDTTSVSYYQTVYDQLKPIDQYFSSEATGLGSPMTDLFKSLHTAVNNPSSEAERSEFMNDARKLADRFTSLAEDLNNAQMYNDSKIEESLKHANELIASIANFNKQLRSTEDKNTTETYNLVDQRDQAIKELADLMDIRTYQDENDKNVTYVLMASGQSLVLEGGEHAELSVRDGRYDANAKELYFTFKNAEYDSPRWISSETLGGELGALFECRSEIDEAKREVGQMAVALAGAFNYQNSCGVDLEGNMGGKLFDTGTVEADGTRVKTDAAGKVVYDKEGQPVKVSNGIKATLEFIPGETNKVSSSDILIEVGDGTQLKFYALGKDKTDKGEPLAVTAQGGKYIIEDLGVSISLDGNLAGIQKGDSFYLRPTADAATNFKTVTNDPARLALAGTVAASAGKDNMGTATMSISALTSTDAVTSDAGQKPAVNESAPTKVTVQKQGNGYVLTVTSKNGQSFGQVKVPSGDESAKENILSQLAATDGKSANLAEQWGFDISLSGTIYAMDTFEVVPSEDGIGNNLNGLALAKLQTDDCVKNGSYDRQMSFSERYSSMTTQFGSVVNSASVNLSAAEAKLEQSTASYQSTSAVSLDEEAANLIQFQQYYAAAAKIISASQSTFDALISVV